MNGVSRPRQQELRDAARQRVVDQVRSLLIAPVPGEIMQTYPSERMIYERELHAILKRLKKAYKGVE